MQIIPRLCGLTKTMIPISAPKDGGSDGQQLLAGIQQNERMWPHHARVKG